MDQHWGRGLEQKKDFVCADCKFAETGDNFKIVCEKFPQRKPKEIIMNTSKKCEMYQKTDK